MKNAVLTLLALAVLANSGAAEAQRRPAGRKSARSHLLPSAGAIPRALVGTSVYCSVKFWNGSLGGSYMERNRNDPADDFRVLFPSAGQLTIRGSDNFTNGTYNVTRSGDWVEVNYGSRSVTGTFGVPIYWKNFPSINVKTMDFYAEYTTTILGITTSKILKGNCE